MGLAFSPPSGSGGGTHSFERNPSRMSRFKAAWSRIITSRVPSTLAFQAAVNSRTYTRSGQEGTWD
eukprot:scaffold218504_cov36-Tisochrysis_lutea.AAC.2